MNHIGSNFKKLAQSHINVVSYIALILIFMWRLYFAASLNLIPDECSYWAWSSQLDWSYFDNSGMVAYLIRLSTSLYRDHSPIVIRLPFLILSIFTTYLIYLISKDIYKNHERALGIAVLFNLTPTSILGAPLAMHDNALIFFWSVALWASVQFQKDEDVRWFYFIGVIAGFAMLSKYTGILLVFCLFFFLISAKSLRKYLLQKEPWLGLLLTFVSDTANHLLEL